MAVAIRVIPCLDVKDGRVVKGVNFVGLRDAANRCASLEQRGDGGRVRPCGRGLGQELGDACTDGEPLHVEQVLHRDRLAGKSSAV